MPLYAPNDVVVDLSVPQTGDHVNQYTNFCRKISRSAIAVGAGGLVGVLFSSLIVLKNAIDSENPDYHESEKGTILTLVIAMPIIFSIFGAIIACTLERGNSSTQESVSVDTTSLVSEDLPPSYESAMQLDEWHNPPSYSVLYPSSQEVNLQPCAISDSSELEFTTTI